MLTVGVVTVIYSHSNHGNGVCSGGHKNDTRMSPRILISNYVNITNNKNHSSNCSADFFCTARQYIYIYSPTSACSILWTCLRKGMVYIKLIPVESNPSKIIYFLLQELGTGASKKCIRQVYLSTFSQTVYRIKHDKYRNVSLGELSLEKYLCFRVSIKRRRMPKETNRRRTLSNISHVRNNFTFLSFRILYGTQDTCEVLDTSLSRTW
jgi:hypothetical protein